MLNNSLPVEYVSLLRLSRFVPRTDHPFVEVRTLHALTNADSNVGLNPWFELNYTSKFQFPYRSLTPSTTIKSHSCFSLIKMAKKSQIFHATVRPRKLSIVTKPDFVTNSDFLDSLLSSRTSGSN